MPFVKVKEYFLGISWVTNVRYVKVMVGSLSVRKHMNAKLAMEAGEPSGKMPLDISNHVQDVADPDGPYEPGCLFS